MATRAGAKSNRPGRAAHGENRAARDAGLYDPLNVVHHHVPADRLTRNYFRRWFFWLGIVLMDLHLVGAQFMRGACRGRVKRTTDQQRPDLVEYLKSL